MYPRILSASARRSLSRSLAPLTTTTAARIHTAFPTSFAYPTYAAGSRSANPTPDSAAPSKPSPAAGFQGHSSDVYSKEVDTSPPENTKLHAIDPEAEVENPAVNDATPSPSSSSASAAAASGGKGGSRRAGEHHPHAV